MKSITAVNMVLFTMIAVTHICFGMDPAWKVKEVSPCTYWGRGQLSELDIVHQRGEGENSDDFCFALLKEPKQLTPIKLNNFEGDTLPNPFFDRIYCMKLEWNNEKKEVYIKHWKSFYRSYPLQRATIGRGIGYIQFNLENTETITLYQSENIDQINTMLKSKERFIVIFEGSTIEKHAVKVLESWSRSLWMSMPQYLNSSSQLKVINVNLDKNKKAELGYRFKGCLICVSIILTGGLILYFFKNIGSAPLYGQVVKNLC